MARKKKPPEHASHERWLVSYADFITLLFAFFVVMFATSASKPEKVEEFVGAVREAFDSYGIYVGTSQTEVVGPPDNSGSPKITIEVENNPSGLSGMIDAGSAGSEQEEEKDYSQTTDKEPNDAVENGTTGAQPTPTPTPEPKAAEGKGGGGPVDMKKMYEDLHSLLSAELGDKIEMKMEKRGIVISLKEAGFFDSGSAEIKNKSQVILDRIGTKMKSLPAACAIRIEGHTDNEPLAGGGRYGDNWELSTGRANCVVQFLIKRHNYSPQRLIASGYGEWRPAADNSTPEGRARNRRVDIVILNENSSEEEAPAGV